jgi:hypothetical protein
MSNRFKAPSEEELAARGLDKDGNPLKKETKKVAPKKEASAKAGDN